MKKELLSSQKREKSKNKKTDKEILNLFASFWLHFDENKHITNKIKSQFDDKSFTKETIAIKSLAVKSEFIMIEPNFMLTLDSKEKELVISIVSEMRLYNMLWFNKHKSNSRAHRAVKSLEKKKILFALPGRKNYYLVSPIWIRRGEHMAVLTTTIEYLKDLHPKEAIEIKDLKSVKASDILYDVVNGFIPTIAVV